MAEELINQFVIMNLEQDVLYADQPLNKGDGKCLQNEVSLREPTKSVPSHWEA